MYNEAYKLYLILSNGNKKKTEHLTNITVIHTTLFNRGGVQRGSRLHETHATLELNLRLK